MIDRKLFSQDDLPRLSSKKWYESQAIQRLQFFIKVWCKENCPAGESPDIFQVEKYWFHVMLT